MIALDTNILVRYISNDDAEQAVLVDRIVQDELTAEQPGFIATIVLCETLWVLHRQHGYPPAALRAVAEALRDTPQFILEHDDCVLAALACGHMELSDAIIHFVGQKMGCSRTLTFDRKFARMDAVELLA